MHLGSSKGKKTKMALVGKKPYPKATVKKIIKAHSDLNIKKNADVAVCPQNSRRVLPTSGECSPC